MLGSHHHSLLWAVIMPAKIIPIVNNKPTTWADIQTYMGGVTRQQAQAKYKKLLALGPVTRAALTMRYQDPVVKARVEANINADRKREILNHARTHGPTHTSMQHNIPRDEVVAMLEQQDREIAAFMGRNK